ncbi:MAG: T9SS type A sorting domain-containing protein, partial [Bacteroidota bacterium]|nr:T9SS type A sorting domain-containing protein [Bacteroidota bacterium]
DQLSYHVALNGYSGSIRAFARVYYQPVPPGWNEEMFSHTSAEIDLFQDMIGSSDGTPTLVVADSISLGPVSINEHLADRISIHPNPSTDGWTTIVSDGSIEIISVHTVEGKLQSVPIEKRNNSWRIQLPAEAGTYMILLKIGNEHRLKHVIRL